MLVFETGCYSYSVPEDIREHIDLIKPTVHFLHRVPIPDQLQKRSFERPSTHIKMGPKTDGTVVDVPPNLANCDETITLDCLRALYSIDYTPVSTDKNTFGICECPTVQLRGVRVGLIGVRPVEFTPQAFLQSDLDMFFA